MFDLSDLTPDDQHRLRSDLRMALIGGLVATAVMSAVVVVVGSVSGAEARSLLESATPTVRSFCSSVMVTTASTVALMLTLLGLTSNTDRQIRGGHYERVRQIATAAVAAFIGATLLLVALVVPLTDSGAIPTGWYVGIYFAMTLLAAVLGGLLVGAMILLHAAIRDLIKTLGPSEETPLLDEEEETDGKQQPGENHRPEGDRRDGEPADEGEPVDEEREPEVAEA